MSTTLYKVPRGKNKFSGNVSLSHEEFDLIKSGETLCLYIEGRDFGFLKIIEPWMIEGAQDKDHYVLFPYNAKSHLVNASPAYERAGKSWCVADKDRLPLDRSIDGPAIELI